MLFSTKSFRFVLLAASLLSANAETIRGVQRELELTPVVDLGTAGNYTILAKTGITNVQTSAILGDIAVSPIAAGSMTGFDLILATDGKSSTSSQVTGMVYAASYEGDTPALLTTAISNMETAYTDAAGRTNNDAARKDLGAGEIGGLTLTPGIYTFATNVDITSEVYLDSATGNNTGSNDTFIIQMAGDLKIAADTKVILKNGVLAENIFWQVAGNVKVMAGATMEGILLAKTDVTFITGSTLNGRVLAQTACVLQKATITAPTN